MSNPALDVQEDVCDLRTVQRISALLDRPDRWTDGDVLPRGWHFGFFIPAEPQSRLPADGFPTPSEWNIDLPPDARVMLGGRAALFDGDIRIGQKLRRTRTVTNVERKNGRSGALTIVSRRHEIFAGDCAEPAIIESEDMIYRAPTQAGGGSPPSPSGPRPIRSSAPRADDSPSPVELFRYSALTFNGHRIHYDASFATGVEGYPGLVVNGGLTALRLVELFRSETGREPVRTDTRNRGPIYCGAPATLNLERHGNEHRLWAADSEGRCAVEMMAR